MNQISAADNIVIDIQAERWRLIVNSDNKPRLLLEATAGGPLRYVPGFADTRRLPDNGSLSPDEVQQVVLGWSNVDEAWHLGLVFKEELAEMRGSRWCEMASWPDPETTVFLGIAREAGQNLARTLTCPFNLIPPKRKIEPESEPVPLPKLPLTFGMWTLDQTESGQLELKRASRWAIGKITRIIWYSFWMVVYVALSIVTLNSSLALPNAGTLLPNPEVLPYLGLFSALVLAGLILRLLYLLLNRPGRICVDPETNNIYALWGERERWRVAHHGVQSVYVTQMLNKKGKKRVVAYGELNIHKGGGEFQHILEQDQPEDNLNGYWKNDVKLEETIQALESDVTITSLQAAGLYIAEALGQVPCWYDQRVK